MRGSTDPPVDCSCWTQSAGCQATRPVPHRHPGESAAAFVRDRSEYQQRRSGHSQHLRSSPWLSPARWGTKQPGKMPLRPRSPANPPEDRPSDPLHHQEWVALRIGDCDEPTTWRKLGATHPVVRRWSDRPSPCAVGIHRPEATAIPKRDHLPAGAPVRAPRSHCRTRGVCRHDSNNKHCQGSGVQLVAHPRLMRLRTSPTVSRARRPSHKGSGASPRNTSSTWGRDVSLRFVPFTLHQTLFNLLAPLRSSKVSRR